jgi:hypothetical protein
VQGAIPVYLDSVDVLEEEAQVLDHEVFPVICGCPTWRLWSQHAVIML